MSRQFRKRKGVDGHNAGQQWRKVFSLRSRNLDQTRSYNHELKQQEEREKERMESEREEVRKLQW